LLQWNVAQGASIKGQVTDGTAPIAGVVVSDGYTVTVTDAAGKYAMEKKLQAKFVFISVPENYEIPAEGNIPRFYYKIDSAPTDMEANFTLKPAAVQDSFVLVALADPQPNKEKYLKRFDSETMAELSAIEKDFPAGTNFVGITAGDLVWNAPQLYPGYVKAFEKISFPVYQVIGNHDHDEDVHEDYYASHYFEQYFGPTYYSFNRGKCHIIGLDNIIHSTRKDYKEEVTQEQLDWLKQDLSRVSKDKLIIISMHAPSMFRNGKTLNNSKALYALLDGYETFFVSGHTHRISYMEPNKHIRDFNLGAVFGDGWSGDISNCGSPNGYGIFKIKGNKLDNYYFKATGHPHSYQMRLYPPGACPDKEFSVIAYIWGWHKGWKMEVFEDGKSKGKMTQFKAFDPEAFDFYDGPEKPKEKPSREPAKTDEIFFYTPQKENCSVKLVVTDNFGNVYTEEIQVKK
jgi:hypothetical protein